MYINLFIVFFLLSLSSLIPSVFADNYYRGNYSCEGFKEMEQLYRSDPESIPLRKGYAHCLITKGEDSEGMSILYHIADRHNDVKAAWVIAEYIHSGGTFEDRIDKHNINEAIEAYGRVVFFISLDPHYPQNGNDIYEAESQMELRTNYRLPLLYFTKFKKGAVGTENIHLLRSPSYERDGDLDTYPKYNLYTMDSLEQMIKFADQCLALPPKRHFQSEAYGKIKAGCQVFKEAATALFPLEQQRLVLLATDSCSDDLPQCAEYYELRAEMVSIIKPVSADIKAIFN